MDGQLIGVSKRPSWKGINPYGMIYVRSGTLTIGSDDQDLSSTYISRPKSISIAGFFMDETEITNNEYRQFVNWVRDSIAHTILGNVEEDENGKSHILWDNEIDYTDEALADMFYSGDDILNGKKEFDVDKLVFNYEWMDWQKAAADRGKSTRKTYIKKEKTKIYPDTMVWIRDFAYSYNEPMTRNYFGIRPMMIILLLGSIGKPLQLSVHGEQKFGICTDHRMYIPKDSDFQRNLNGNMQPVLVTTVPHTHGEHMG